MDKRPYRREDLEGFRASRQLRLVLDLSRQLIRWQWIRLIVWGLPVVVVCIAALIGKPSTPAAVVLVGLGPWLAAGAARAWVGELERVKEARAHRRQIKRRIREEHRDQDLLHPKRPSVSEPGVRSVLADLSRFVFLALLALLGTGGAAVGVVRLAERNVLLLAMALVVFAVVALLASAYWRVTERRGLSYSAPFPSLETELRYPRWANSPGSASTPTSELKRAIADDAELDHVARRLAELFEAADQDQIEAATRAHDPDQIATALGISAEELQSLIDTVFDRARDHGRQFPELYHLGRRLGI